jgi:hypothetical protein
MREGEALNVERDYLWSDVAGKISKGEITGNL